MTHDTHHIELRDITDAGMLVADYVATQTNPTAREGRYVSTVLPLECLTLFDGGRVDVDDLTAEERQWLTAESGARSNEIDFEGVRA